MCCNGLILYPVVLPNGVSLKSHYSDSKQLNAIVLCNIKHLSKYISHMTSLIWSWTDKTTQMRSFCLQIKVTEFKWAGESELYYPVGAKWWSCRIKRNWIFAIHSKSSNDVSMGIRYIFLPKEKRHFWRVVNTPEVWGMLVYENYIKHMICSGLEFTHPNAKYSHIPCFDKLLRCCLAYIRQKASGQCSDSWNLPAKRQNDV